jgi:WD40 repeat protein
VKTWFQAFAFCLHTRASCRYGQVTMTFKGHSKAIRAIAASPDIVTAVSASDDGNLMLWDTITGQDSGVLTGHKGPVLACCFARGGERVLSGGKDRAVRVWDVGEGGGGGVLVAEAALEGHTGRITGLASMEGGFFASCSADRTTRVWDLEEQETVRELTGHSGGLTSLAATSTAALAVTTSLDYTARAWDLRDPYGGDGGGGQVRKFSLPDVPVGCATCARQDAWIGVVAGDGLYVYDTRVWREIAYFQGLANLTCMAFHGGAVKLNPVDP